MKCPKCGGTTGLSAIGKFTQYFKWDGEPDGYEFDMPLPETACCMDCGRRFKRDTLQMRFPMDGEENKP